MRSIALIGFCFLCIHSAAQSSDSLRIITYNIHHANPPSKPGAIDVEAIINVFKKYPADVIALQEVDVNTKRSGNIDEAKLVADALGMHFFFARAIDYDGGYYGVALLSRLPLRDTQIIRLPMDSTMKGEQRVLAVATISTSPKQNIIIGCTHLDHQKNSKNRQLQIATIKEFAKKTSLPFLLAGDFNAEAESDIIKQLDEDFQRTCDKCPSTFPAIFPLRTIDFIAFKKSKKMKALSHQVLPESYASDHLPVKAVIQLQ
jgi:endonuclease/exonuclease/phosphatase family metal-dependent hydrolase